MTTKLPAWKDQATLVPHSGIQFLEFGFSLDDTGRASWAYVERVTERVGDQERRVLIPLTGDEAKDAQLLGSPQADDAEYSINKAKALEPFLSKWVPVPVLRIGFGRREGGAERYDEGPTTWARMRVVEMPERTDGLTHRVVLALDTTLEDPADAYLAPTASDAKDEREFRLVSDPDEMAWFLSRPVTEDGPDGPEEVDRQGWVSEWLEEMYLEFRQAQRPGRPINPADFPYSFEHWARYLSFLRLIDGACRIPSLRLLDTVSEDRRYQPVEVDLVLDLGNSRTCGILVESFPDDDAKVDLNNSYALALRDLGRPESVARRPFESRVEFAEASFGREHLARRSGRARAFLWPSVVRVGPEATRLAGDTEGTETTSGLSSPKRYLWDDRPVNQDWRIHGAGRQTLPLILRSAFRFLNDRGDVLAQVEEDLRRRLRDRRDISLDRATRPRFSRSSLYGFMLGELFMHAITQINDPAARLSRKQSDVPRRLRRVILSLPAATPMQEQAIMRSRAEGAMRLIWQILGWDETTSQTTRRPPVSVEWDEASCTQFVWLYSEITQKFAGQIQRFLELKGKPRPLPEGGAEQPSLRLACIDVGGGTTDLMVITHYAQDNRAVRPRQTFREGFRIAGDDLVREVVGRIVLGQIRGSLEAAGLAHAEERLRELFGGELGDIDEQDRQRRRQFSLRVLTPLAIAALETSERLAPGETRTVRAGDVLGWRDLGQGAPSTTPPEAPDAPSDLALPEELLAYLEAPAAESGWRVRDFEMRVDRTAVDAAVRAVFEKVLADMVEVIQHLDCDVVLLSGRPSRLPAVREIVREMLPVAPDRLVSLHNLRVDGWYPFRDPVTNRIGDPKTTAAVGAMLCNLAEREIANFRFLTQDLAMRSTARFFGEMELQGQILGERLLFQDLDLNTAGGDEARLNMYTTVQIGFRQLPLERWTATPLYRLEFATPQAAKRPVPIRVTLARREYDDGAETEAERLKAEALKEAFEIADAEDAEGDRVDPIRDVRLRLHTLGFDDDYWLDTGLFRLH